MDMEKLLEWCAANQDKLIVAGWGFSLSYFAILTGVFVSRRLAARRERLNKHTPEYEYIDAALDFEDQWQLYSTPYSHTYNCICVGAPSVTPDIVINLENGYVWTNQYNLSNLTKRETKKLIARAKEIHDERLEKVKQDNDKQRFDYLNKVVTGVAQRSHEAILAKHRQQFTAAKPTGDMRTRLCGPNNSVTR